MIRWNLSPFALSFSIAAALLSGCTLRQAQGDMQPPIGAPGVPPQNSALVARTSSANYKVLYSFAGSPDGNSPGANMIDVRGKLYGTTQSGGTYNTCGSSVSCGTVFRITTDGKEKVLYSFHALPDGDNPSASLLDVGGTLYGTTKDGGAYIGGTVFRVTLAGRENVLHSFGNGTDGVYPSANLIEVGGKLYGTTAEGGGGTGIRGTVFSITTSGTEKVLRTFNGRRGSLPLAGLIDVDGTLYGTTAEGGAHGDGVVFRMTPSGKEKVLHSFSGPPDGAEPVASLIDVNGTLYGTTWFGGANRCGSADGCGTVFSITPGGKEKVLHSFGSGTDGFFPVAPLIDVKGTLYGTTNAGGSYCGAAGGCGIIFSVTRAGAETVLHSFGGPPDGCCSLAGLTDVGGTLYGTTSAGGTNGYGTVFALTP